MAPPSAALERGTFDVASGIKPFTSAAGGTSIPQSLVLTCLIALIVYNLAFILFDIDLPAIINFSKTVCRTIIEWIRDIRHNGLRATILAIVEFSVNWIKDCYRSHMYAHAFLTGLGHIISNPTERLG